MRHSAPSVRNIGPLHEQASATYPLWLGSSRLLAGLTKGQGHLLGCVDSTLPMRHRASRSAAQCAASTAAAPTNMHTCWQREESRQCTFCVG